MNIYIYKTETGGSNPNRTIIKLSAECSSDNEYLQAIIRMIKEREFLRDEVARLADTFGAFQKRISDTQSKMHEATTELAKVKKSWMYRVLKFFPDNFSITKPRGCK